MNIKIKVVSHITVLEQDYEYKGAVPSEKEFLEHGDSMDLVEEYDADYMDLAEYFELSYVEIDEETGRQSRRILIHEKGLPGVTIRREEMNAATDNAGMDIVIEKDVLHKNEYHIDELGTLSLETFGLSIEWDDEIRLRYLTNMNGLWSRIEIQITFGGIA